MFVNRVNGKYQNRYSIGGRYYEGLFLSRGFQSGIYCYFKGYIVRLLVAYEEKHVC
ncbi:unnamed protein product [marine sediment metagenome]|uniref:Uncharacterized protein n=1 Tax=marine sediment metagenome TaxID=412755 RepID=X0XAF9_9ZZZZ